MVFIDGDSINIFDIEDVAKKDSIIELTTESILKIKASYNFLSEFAASRLFMQHLIKTRRMTYLLM
jgi:histidine ammonia-lyase